MPKKTEPRYEKAVKIGTLKPTPMNPNDMDEVEMGKLEKGIKQFGFVQPIVAHERTRRVIGGHQRLKAAENLGLKTVPVIWVSLSKHNVAALNIALNKIKGQWDYPMLKDIITELDTGAFDMELTGFDEDELEGIFGIDGDGGKKKKARSTGATDALEYTLVFESKAHKYAFTGFLTGLTGIYPELDTHAARLVAYIKEQVK